MYTMQSKEELMRHEMKH